MIQQDAHVYAPRFDVAKKAGNAYVIFGGPKEKYSGRRARSSKGRHPSNEEGYAR